MTTQRVAAMLVLLCVVVLAAGSPAPERPHPNAKIPASCATIPLIVEITRPDMPPLAVWGSGAYFGLRFSNHGTGAVPLALPSDLKGCALPRGSIAEGRAVLTARGDCEFATKASNVQEAGGALMLMSNNISGCVPMWTADEAMLNKTSSTYAACISEEVGDLLTALLLNGTRVSVNVWAVGGGPNINMAVLWLIAVGTVAGASVWSAAETVKPPGATGPRQPQTGLPKQELTETMAAMFIFLASGMLLVLFFFFSHLVMLVLVGAFSLISCQAFTLMVLPAAQAMLPKALRQPLSLSWFDNPSVADLLACGAALSVTLTWALYRNTDWAWPLQDILGVSVCFLFLRTVQMPNLKVAMVLLPLAFSYDVFWVFIQPLLTHGTSVMVKVATGGDSQEAMPMVLRVPRLGSELPGYAILGLGDIVLPGLLVAFTRAVDISRGRTLFRGYFFPCLTGYGTGLLLTYGALIFSIFGKSGQPALLYLVPCTLGTVVVQSLCRGELRSLMRSRDGLKASVEDPEARGQAVDWNDGNSAGGSVGGSSRTSERAALLLQHP